MKEGFRQAMAWLHTWSGLVVGWLLFAIFVTGTLAYFRPEITQWMQPELPREGSTEQHTEAAERYLREVAPVAQSWIISLPDGREPQLRVFWRELGASGRFERELLDPLSGEPTSARDTMGGNFFYRFHFELAMPNPWGRYLVGLCAMFMLVAIITGIVTHKKIFKEFFTFRPRKGQRSWLDFHNVSSVLALPFHLMITYTGLITLMLLYMPSAVELAYDGDRGALFSEAFPQQELEPAEVRAPLAPLAPIVAQAEARWGQDASISRIDVQYPGDQNASVTLQRGPGQGLSHETDKVRFDGVSGELLGDSGALAPAASTRQFLYGLHVARFAPELLRWLFFVSGLTGCLMIATGLVLWTVKRRPQHLKSGRLPFGHALVEGLNVAVVAGLPLAIAVFFHANRLLPVGIAQRADWEVRVFLACWLAALIHALLRAPRQAWIEQLVAGAIGYLLLPMVNLLTTGDHLPAALMRGDGVAVGFDLTALACGTALALVARAVYRRGKTVPAQEPRQADGPSTAMTNADAQTG
ncbi:PepSY-associated TM helix domain-containing protein [Algiphilus aromaticivorans]|uniref:PepSY-associated TM helix domain-containing protein n=1 Tax=Algiphilus aromaticivorans TaxID=382454 RepID=UPI0005C18072|nr:PepSY-associated TM helix domain-containing protein [Algiphilus aromaticivorans]